MELLIKRILFFLFLATLFFVCCSKNGKVEKEDSTDFYELCFYFSKLPSNAVLSDIEKAAETYSETFSKSGISVLSRKSTLSKSCWFLDKEPNISEISAGNTQNEVANYLLKAFFKKESASLYGIKNSGKTIKNIHDETRFTDKLPAAGTYEEGLSFKGWNAKMLYLSHYLDNIGVQHSFGTDSGNGIILNIPADIQERWKIALFLYSSIDFENTIKPVPGDFALFTLCGNEKAEVSVKKSGWNKTEAGKADIKNGRNAIIFKSGAADLAVSEEVALKYLYSLAQSHKLPFESGSFYSPNFAASSVTAQLYLFSGELGFSTEVSDPESLFLWVISSERQLETYPDTMYANLLSLKIAKKLVFADKTFLGGKDLDNKKQFVDFEAVRDSFFSSGNVLISGKMPENLYLFSGGTIKESTSVADISEVSGFKALFGDPEINDTSIVTFVLRSANAKETLEKIEESLVAKGFEPIHRMFEKIGDGDNWGSVSVKTAISNESRLISLYDKEYKNFDKTLSIGVYRVAEK